MDVSLYKLSAKHGNISTTSTIPYNLPGHTDVNSESGDYCRDRKMQSLRNFPATLLLMSWMGCATNTYTHYWGPITSAFMR